MFKSRKGVKQKYKIIFVSASNVPDNATLCVAWKRGAKKENKGSTSTKPVKAGLVEWNETVAIVCTLFKEGVIYDAKASYQVLYSLTSKECCLHC